MLARLPRVLLLVPAFFAFACLPVFARQDATPVPFYPLPPTTEIELRVMTFNVWLGGIQIDFAKVVEAIDAADADVVGLQEAEGNSRRIADALGWQYVDDRNQVISRYPLIDPPGGNGTYLFVEPIPGHVVALANLHLPSSPYGPELIRDGASLDDVTANELATRLEPARRYLDALPPLVEQGIPVVITGDFNTPSHLDWTEAMTATREQVTVAYEWPVGVAFEEAGFTDTYRAAHPDPTRVIGITWTPGYPPPFLRDGEVVDRIDWVLASGDIETVDSQLVGVAGGPDVAIGVTPWPSDHQAVVSTLRLTPAVPPFLVAVETRRVERGEPIVVRYHAPAAEGERVGIVAAGGDPSEAIMTLPPQESFAIGSMMFGSAALEPAQYEALLLDPAGGELARTTFWVVEPGAEPVLSLDTPTVEAGEPVEIRWENAPAFKWDWLGVYAAGDSDLYNYLAFQYTGATVSGSATIDESWFGAPLAPGSYEVRLMRDDGYVVLATVTFDVAGA